MNYLIASFIVSAILVMILVPLLSRLAGHIGLVDKPDNARKLHQTPIPMVGGLGIFIAAICSAPLILFFFQEAFNFRPTDATELTGLAIGGTLIILIGLLDDIFQLRGRQKLIGQIVAITVLIATGFHFESFTIAGFKPINFGIFSVLVIYAWMIAAINSINLLDGADGFATTIGLIMTLALGAMAVYQGKMIDAVIAFSLAGAMIAFLWFNFPPARAFLGDSGSMLIGFMIGALAIRCTLKQATAYALFAPIALLAIPFMDTAAAIIRRRLTGRSIYTVDRGHLHHQFAKQGYSPRISLLWVALLCSMTAIGGVVSMIYKQSEYALVSIVIVAVVLFFARIFGLAEFRLVRNKAISVTRSFVRLGKNKSTSPQTTSIQLQGSRDWQELWKRMCDFAEENELNQLTMDLNVPWMHESFHATWRSAEGKKDVSKKWYSQVPLLVEGRVFGRVEIEADLNRKIGHRETINYLLKSTEDIERTLADIENETSGSLVNEVLSELEENSESFDEGETTVPR